MRTFITKGGLALGCLLMSGSASWGVDLAPEKVIALKIAQTGLTRVSVQDDKIQDIFVTPSEAASSIQLHQSGHVFVSAEGLSPVSMTVITERGVVQDLRLTPVSQPPSPVILKERRPLPPPVSLQRPARTADEILADFVFRGGSLGFDPVPSKGSRQGQGRVFEARRSWGNGQFRVTLYEAASGEETAPQKEIVLAEVKRDGDFVLAPGPRRDSFYVVESF